MATLAEMLRQGADKLINLPSEAQRFVTNPQAFTQLLTGKNPLPRETGFAAGATGLPAQEMSVLDPNQAPYMQGYEQGEPIGYAGMAATFAAPKAGQMAENYMVRQGMIQPLTAYHGTPHTIQGQFDINKVGTGEGAQAYGHGMYFAENPAVAKQYIVNAELQKTPEGMARSYAQTYPSEVEALSGAKQRLQRLLDDGNVAEAKTQEQIVQALESGKLGGNLYKVDIPDKDIPNMLNWDEPLKNQPIALKAIRSAITDDKILKSFDENVEKGMLGETAYKNWVNLNWVGEKGRPTYKTDAEASAKLNELGIKGIRYLDEGSRNPAVQPYYQLIRKSDNAVYTQMQDLKSAEEFVKNAKKQGVDFEISAPVDKRTSNFVVFEPSNVKILEKNNQPVSRKELIQQQIDKIE